MSEQPKISLVTILHGNTEFFPLFQHHLDTLDYPKDKLEWIIIDDGTDKIEDLVKDHPNVKYYSYNENQK